MPELPEVETIVRGLRPSLRGRRVGAVWGSGQRLHLRRKVDLAGLRARAVGQTIQGVRRLGKYILIGLDGGRGRAPGTVADGGVIVHLGMTGRLRVQPKSAPRVAHTHLVLSLAGGDELRFSDPRRFGWVEPAASFAANPALARLGPDPLAALDEAALADALAGVRAPIKAFLLDQHRIAGLGNIYVSEALFRAGIRPTLPAGRARRRAGPLLAGIRAALENAIDLRGTTLRDYVGADGMPGDNASALLVYGRAGEPCTTCGTAIRRRVDAGRATFYCPSCQRA
jgi:formamidopyrimidine-DNA glycosylase